MINNKKLNPLICSYGFSDGGIGFHDDNAFDRSGMVGGGSSHEPSGSGRDNAYDFNGPSYDPGDWTGWNDGTAGGYIGNDKFKAEFDAAMDKRTIEAAKDGLKIIGGALLGQPGLVGAGVINLVMNLNDRVVKGLIADGHSPKYAELAAKLAEQKAILSMQDAGVTPSGGPTSGQLAGVVSQAANNISVPSTGSTLSDAWNKFVDTWDGETPINEYKSPLDMYNAEEKFIQDQAGKYTDKLSGAESEQNKLLSDLINDAQNKSGYFSPVNFTIQGQNVSFVPKSNRATASMISDFGQSRLDNTSNIAKNILGGDLLKNPTLSEQNYLGKLENAAKLAADEAYRQKDLSKNISIKQQQIDNSQPGLLDYAKGGLSLFSTLKDLNLFG